MGGVRRGERSDVPAWRQTGGRAGLCRGGRGGASQRPVPRLVFGQDLLAAAELLPHVAHLHAQRRVLLLQEAGADGDLVLLQSPGVAGPLGRQVVLPAPGPVPVVLNQGRRQTVSVGSVQQVGPPADLKNQHRGCCDQST